jgi:cytochrome c biogenesis protein CcmG/thiol:disulfide interchange protein DsbE
MRWTKLILLVLAAVVVGQLLVQTAERRPTLEGTPALVLPALDGRTVDLAALRGRVVAVNFWATWCAPCQVELPELVAVWNAGRDRCFELLGVVEESARADVVEAARHIPYPVLVDASATVAAAWGVQGYPRTYLVDPGGTVRRVFVGAITRGDLEAAVEPLRPASCPAR